MRRCSFVCLAVVVLIRSAGAQQPELPTTLEAAARDAERAGRLSEAFDLYVKAVQALPDPPPPDADVRLRERTIALASRLPAPAPVPEDAERFTVRGQLLAKEATDLNGWRNATSEFRKAVRAAPWIPELAYNLALAEQKSEAFADAIANLKLYLQSSPEDAATVRADMYALELRKESADRASEASRVAPITVYLYRPSHFTGGGSDASFYCDNNVLASVHNGRYLAVRLAPGLHSCGLKAHILAAEAVTVGPEPGSEYFLETTRPAMKSMGVKIVTRDEALTEMATLKPSEPKNLKDSRAFIPTIPPAPGKP